MTVLLAIYKEIKSIPDTTEAEKTLTMEIIQRLDHVTFGCFCEYPDMYTADVAKTYKEFRLRFRLEMEKRKMRDWQIKTGILFYEKECFDIF